MTTSVLILTVGAIGMAIMAMFIRMKAMKKPASTKKIILPPLFMSTGFFMFLYEPARLSLLQVIEAIVVGLLFSLILIKTSKFEIKNNHIYLQRSKAFIVILVGLLLVRVTFKLIIGDAIQMEELAGMFFILAYGMILPWRISMLIQFKKLEQRLYKKSSDAEVHA